MKLQRIQQEHAEWMVANFGEVHPWRPLLGIVEEVGELAHAELKERDGIRGGWSEAQARDAVGDIAIFLMGYCSRRGLDFQECVESVWDRVKRRDWRRFPQNGVTA